ncbi:MAG: type II toxin-antitoxin system VapC family toxin [Deltaproteobacteria bacterium]|nr:type II toxin-antitoxin system VapC family toxin [Deltaproteobacteria bacterium]
MKLLLDTHVLLWWLFNDDKLSIAARALIADRANKILISSASGWEIATKYRLGKLPSASTLVQDIPGWVQRAGFTELPVTLTHAQRAGLWPQKHRDPFDRMLAAQCYIENISLISCDNDIHCFNINIIW